MLQSSKTIKSCPLKLVIWLKSWTRPSNHWATPTASPTLIRLLSRWLELRPFLSSKLSTLRVFIGLRTLRSCTPMWNTGRNFHLNCFTTHLPNSLLMLALLMINSKSNPNLSTTSSRSFSLEPVLVLLPGASNCSSPLFGKRQLQGNQLPRRHGSSPQVLCQPR